MGTILKMFFTGSAIPEEEDGVCYKTGKEVEEEDYEGCMLLLPILYA
jgi:hypothetical protein